MWQIRVKEPNAAKYVISQRLQAVTLVEILTTLALGSLLFIIIAKFFSDTFYAQNRQRERLNLQQHTHQLLDYMNNHIQHIGYLGKNRNLSNSDLFLSQGKSYKLKSNKCLLFFYDINGDGCIGNRNKTQACVINGLNNTKDVNKEIFGFYLKNHNLFVFDDNKLSKCRGAECLAWAESCDKNKWSNISELSDYKIADLTFKWLVEERVLATTLVLSSTKMPTVKYQATAYSYMLNSGE